MRKMCNKMKPKKIFMKSIAFLVFCFLLQCSNGNSADSDDPTVTGTAPDDDTTVTSTAPDADHDGLIELSTAEMLNNMRYNLAGTSYKTPSDGDGDGDSSGCPEEGCHGYELTANIDLLSLLDTNNNGIIDTTTVEVAGEMHTVIDVSSSGDTSWVPVGDSPRNAFTGTFEGNNHTISNLWVNVASRGDVSAGLFGVTDDDGTRDTVIRNVGVISGGVYSSSTVATGFFSSSGGLVGSASAPLMVMNSYFSGVGGVSSSTDSTATSSSGGLVGSASAPLMVMNSYFSGVGGVSSSTDSSYSGGLVGSASASLVVMNSYFSGMGGVSSTGSFSSSGGLVGDATLITIMNSYFSGVGGVSSSTDSSSSGGLVGSVSIVTITDSYWNTDVPQTGNNISYQSMGVGSSISGITEDIGLTLAQLRDIGGTYPNLLGSAWDLGTPAQLPAVKRCNNPTVDDSGSSTTVTCASYGALLAGQR